MFSFSRIDKCFKKALSDRKLKIEYLVILNLGKLNRENKKMKKIWGNDSNPQKNVKFELSHRAKKKVNKGTFLSYSPWAVISPVRKEGAEKKPKVWWEKVKSDTQVLQKFRTYDKQHSKRKNRIYNTITVQAEGRRFIKKIRAQ